MLGDFQNYQLFPQPAPYMTGFRPGIIPLRAPKFTDRQTGPVPMSAPYITDSQPGLVYSEDHSSRTTTWQPPTADMTSDKQNDPLWQQQRQLVHPAPTSPAQRQTPDSADHQGTVTEPRGKSMSQSVIAHLRSPNTIPRVVGSNSISTKSRHNRFIHLIFFRSRTCKFVQRQFRLLMN